MMFRNASFVSSRRRHQHLPVAASISPLETRSLLSGVAIYPQPASVDSQAATPGYFVGTWVVDVQNQSVLIGLDLGQSGSAVYGTYRVNDGGIHDIPFTGGTVNKKKLTIPIDDPYYIFTLQVKLKGSEAFKGKLIDPLGNKFKATGSRVT